MKKNLIFTATLNEYPNIKVLLESIKKLKINFDCLIIDDNSSDGTKEFLKNYQKKNKNIYLIFRKNKLGLDTAHKTAINFAKTNNYVNLITMDADLSHDPKMIPYFLKKLKTENFVIGSRYMKGGKCDMKGFRKLLSYTGNKIIKFILSINCNEFTTSYRGFKIKKIKKINFSQIKSKGYSFFMEVIFLLSKSKVSISEIPIHFKIRSSGYSKIPKIEILRTLFNLFRLKINNLLSYY